MIEFNIIYFCIFFIITAVQSIVGVGVLVLGTPFLLLLGNNIIDTISILLPISILTSLTNLIYLNLYDKEKVKKIKIETLNIFFTLGIFGMLAGIILLKNFYNILNFKILVSIILIISIFLKNLKKNVNQITNRNKQIILFATGLIHGLTNSGGSLLSLFFLQLNKNSKDQSRYEITFFYFFLAIAQYIFFLLILEKNFYLIIFSKITLVCFFGIIVGNIYFKYFSNKIFKYLVECLVFISAVFLLINYKS